MTAVLAAGALICAAAPAANAAGVTVAVVPRATTVGDLASIPGMSVGVISAGIGEVPPEQTFLDVSQGKRIDDALYDRELTGLYPFAREVPGWPEVVDRAEGAPADLVPGMLAQELDSRGIPAYSPQPMQPAALIAADRRGVVSPLRPGACAEPCLAVIDATLAQLPKLAMRLRGDDLLIAIASPPPAPNRGLSIGIAGRGIHGELTSDSTRTDGYVLSTDIAPTILSRLGVPVPDQMDGEPIRAEGAADPAAVEELADRVAVIPERRAPVLIASLLAWIAVALAGVLVAPPARRAAAAWLGLCFAYMPLILLVGAWLEPSGAVEGLLVGLGAAGLAALTVRFAWGWTGLAIACAITVIAYAIDVIAGSGLTRLSLLGPNPIFGARFYGIGNELEALFAVMVPVGVAAGLSAYTGWGREVSRGRAVAAFLSVAAIAAIVFGAGRFGADAGAAIVLPVGGAVAAAAVSTDLERSPGSGPGKRSGFTLGRVLAAGVAAPLIALILVALIDLVSGGDSHLTRSVTDAGGAANLSEVVERRLRLSGHDFARAAANPLYWIVVVGIGAAVARWRRIDAWLRPAPIARAGLIGACAAVAVGVLVNDSGATFLVLGALALGAFLALAWAQARQVQ
ncbi:MAG TPA: hypothetical protein VLB79_04890 [Solirubrobacterales bacterium]|nr:hypothetical protein [Solirubrobacterales bacterium]